jgi:hypothetical protein
LYNLAQLLALLDANQNGFAKDFATQLKFANMGDPDAITYVNNFFEPDDKELEAFGIHESRWDPTRVCTESGLFVLAKCKEKAPEVFQ